MKRLFLFLLFLLIIAGLGHWYYNYYEEEEEQNAHLLTLYGNVDIRQVQLGFRVLGRVIEMPFEEGDLVQPNQLMGRLDPQPFLDQVFLAQARVETIKVSLDNAEKIFQRRKELLPSGGISQEEYDDALANQDQLMANLEEARASLGIAETNLKDTEVFCPTEGTILSRIREPGSVVEPSQPIYTLSILNPVWVRAYVNEMNLGKIFPGMEATITTDTHGNKTYKGHIGFISPLAEFTPKTVETMDLRTDLVYRLRIIVDDPDHGLRQGMPVTAHLNLQPAPSHGK